MRRKLFDLAGVLALAAAIASLVLLVRANESGFGELGVVLSEDDLAAGFREGLEVHTLYLGSDKEIGRASCRERVCYVV